MRSRRGRSGLAARRSLSPGGQTAGPFFATFPAPPGGWGAAYAINIPGPLGVGSFQVVAMPTNGDNGGVAVISP